MNRIVKNKWLNRVIIGFTLFFIALFLVLTTYVITVGDIPNNEFLFDYPLMVLLWIIPIVIMGYPLMAYTYSGLVVAAFVMISLYNDSYQHIYHQPKLSTYIIIICICLGISGIIEYYHRLQLKKV